jgi:hypothetical protein
MNEIMDVRKVKLFIKSSQDIQQIKQRKRTNEHAERNDQNRSHNAFRWCFVEPDPEVLEYLTHSISP